MAETENNYNEMDSVKRLCLLGFCLCLLFVLINLTWTYHQSIGLDHVQRILPTIGLYFFASILTLVAVRIGIGLRYQHRRLTRLIVCFAIGFRVIQLCIPPILEIDLYRYMWDGIVINNGMSPYRYSPNQVLTDRLAIEDQELRKIIDLGRRTESIHEIVTKVHFPDYTTIYPPVSQAVFAAAMRIVPDSASAEMYLFTMRTILVAFDLVTMFLIFGLLRVTRMPMGWSMAYAWNPLVIKEVANSGHLDSVAVSFATAAAYVFLSNEMNSNHDLSSRVRRSWKNEIGSALLLALGTGAKLYPVIVVPFFMFAVGRESIRRAVCFGITYAVATTIFIAPMLFQNPNVREYVEIEPPHRQQSEVKTGEAKQGLTSFLSRWRMNDVIFSFVYENAKPESEKKFNRPWYIVVPNAARLCWNRFVKEHGFSQNPSFLAARLVTVSIYILIYVLLMRRFHARPFTNKDFLNSLFLIIATFFILQPTQNPWYWLWAMPLVCFTPNKGWLLVSSFLFCYYVRFWFKYSDLEIAIGEFQYKNEGIFDHCLAWLEHAAIAAAIAGFALMRWRILDNFRTTKNMSTTTPRE